MAIQIAALPAENEARESAGGLRVRWVFGKPRKRGDIDPMTILPGPDVFLAEGPSTYGYAPHFHLIDQFQFIPKGHGAIGKRKVKPGSLHYAKAFSPYGPLVCDDPNGIAYFTIRLKTDPGGKPMPESAPLRKGRKPFGFFVDVDMEGDGSSVVAGPYDDGLQVARRHFEPGRNLDFDVPANCGGQIGVVLSGEFTDGGRPYPWLSCIAGDPSDSASGIAAGSAGVDLMVLTFPA